MGALDSAVTAFRTRFGGEPDGVFEAPGRVNLIGEHTDYNGGLVLPIALPQRTYAAVRRTGDTRLRLVSAERGAAREWFLGDIAPGFSTRWERYPAGVLWAMAGAGYAVGGVEAAFASDVPVGSGLSSSAAIEAAMAAAAAEVFGTDLLADDAGRARLAGLCQTAENAIAGAPTGGMDQAASLRSRAGHALYLDCADAAVRHVPFRLADAGLTLLVTDTRATHAHASGEYGSRRADCDAACARLGLDTLREITPSDLPQALDRLDTDRLRRRVRHVVTETARVRQAVTALEASDFAELGRLFVDSHASLRDDYEVSCPELDLAVVTALEAGALGARMTGGGFGGSAIALVFRAAREAVQAAITAAYAAAGFVPPEFLVAEAAGPAGRSNWSPVGR